jgi:hypothetical protein
MSGQVWTPDGAAAPPPSVKEFLAGVHAQIQAFADQCDCERAIVEVMLHDGRRLRLRAISAEPGFGWVTLQPFPEDIDDDATDGPVEESLILPLQSIVRIVMRRPEDEEPQRFGFVPPDDLESPDASDDAA